MAALLRIVAVLLLTTRMASAKPSYEEVTVPMPKEDSLVLMTTGLLAPRNKHSEAFGRDRLLQLLAKQNTTDVDWLLEEIRSAITLHSYDEFLRDDQALLIVGQD